MNMLNLSNCRTVTDVMGTNYLYEIDQNNKYENTCLSSTYPSVFYYIIL